jgi:twinkle protein
MKKEPCPECRKNGKDNTGDNLVVYEEGRGAHCFACGYHVHGDGSDYAKVKPGKKLTKPITGVIKPLNHRRIGDRTTGLYGYKMARIGKTEDSPGKIVEVANYIRDGEIVAQHIRGKGKNFRWAGDTSDLPLFGQWLWGGTGKRIVITEGEIDCMTLSQMWDNRWPVVSLPSGAEHAPKAIRTNHDFLAGYDEIVLAFDNDEPGRTAAKKCAELLPAGKVKIAHLPYKDANECLLRDSQAQCLGAIYDAKTFQPDGIMHVSDVRVEDRPHQQIWPFPWRSLTKALMGQRSGEMTLWASGAGSGKSTIIRELGYHHLQRGRRVGMLMLEESPAETLDDLISLKLSKPVRQIRAARELNEVLIAEGDDALEFAFCDDLTQDEYAEGFDYFAKMPLFIYDHNGTNEFNSIMQRIEYMASALACDVILVDHVTAVVAGMDRSGSEREDIDKIMKNLRSIVERTGIHLDIVSQLNRLEGKAAEEGGQISLKNLRGSGSLATVPNSVIAIERNQQAECPEERRTIRVRSLKGRFTGETGVAGLLRFNPETRRLDEAEWHEPQGDNDGQAFQPEDADFDGILDEGEPQRADQDDAPHHAAA